MTDHQESAQLADLSGDGVPDLVFFGQPLRVYSGTEIPFTDITFSLGFPALRDISDAAIGDFDGDGDNDLFLTVGRYIESDYDQPDSSSLRASIYGHGKTDPLADVKGIEFSTRGPVTFQLAPTWVDAAQIRIGHDGHRAVAKRFTLDPQDHENWGPIADSVLTDGAVAIAFDPERHQWRIRNSLTWQYIDVIAHSDAPIENVEPLQFRPFAAQGRQVLLRHGADGFQLDEAAVEQLPPTTCMSSVAGDFDNDMDLDIYVVCTGAIRNSPNLLFENDGAGQFHVVPDAGGAEGTTLGRGDSVVTADYDEDGLLDLFVTNGADPTSPFTADAPHQLFRNLSNNGNHWLEIDLVGTESTAAGIGSRVEVVAGGVSQFREQSGGMHRFSQNFTRLHFGLGPHERAESVRIRWPSGIVQTLHDVAADHILKVREARP